MDSIDNSTTIIRKNLNRFIRELTDDGKLDFESIPYQNLQKEVANQDEEGCENVIEVLLDTTSRSGCPDRKLILQLFNSFFLQFPIFRENLLNDPSEFLELMFETNPIRNPLPGSKKHGNELKVEAITVIKSWEKEKCVKNDARMKCLVVTLKKTKFVDYENGAKKIEAERKRKKILEERKMKMIENSVNVYSSKYHEIKNDAETLSMELTTTMQMLVPSFTTADPEVPSTSTSTPSAISDSKSFEIFIPDLTPEISVSSENDAIVEAFLGAKLSLIHRVQTLRKLVKRLQLLKQPGEKLAQEIIDYRDGIKNLVLKADELRIINPRPPKNKRKKSDDDFIDVDISIDDILMVQYAEKLEVDVKSKDESEKITESPEKHKIEMKNEKPVKIKTVPFGLDLKYWGEERKDVEVPKNNADCHRFWRSADEGTVAGKAQQSIYTQRQYTFIGKAPDNRKVCLAKMKSGKLCPRKDYYTCPLHGKIVDRDDEGRPINEEDRLEENYRKEQNHLKEADKIRQMIEKEYESKTKRRKKHDVDTTASEDVRNRLQKKLLDPKTIQRVSADLDASRKNRLEKNFGQQFSHF
ncbi:UV-stimulated scaffold protein A homolog [Caenorhabditis elegans]|nr:UV-stimulated scaffold protein A homolog [Caenorhabditis elegans]CCD65778.2 UV-stimulated scaffold protein A homolog [Caenorhabditis elegans]|eukprot:NP_505012.2 UV-stimulated scaffold protein A homolog [Caenorhabditis elegans]